MNKYLIKIAQLHPLEEGVNWDDKKKEVVISSSKATQHFEHKRNVHGAIGALSMSPYGAMIGFGSADIVRRKTPPGSLLHLHPKTTRIGGAVLGAGLSAAGGFALYKGIARKSINKKEAKDEFQSKMESKHQRLIDRIEGWE